MDANTLVAPAPGVMQQRGAYRGGRGMGAPMRGGFDRGRGRGIGRGHYMGGMGRGGPMGGGPPQGMMPGGRGMRPPRGGPGGYQGRGGYIPRGGPPMRGGRPPMYMHQPKQHTGADNNKTVSPVPTVNTTTPAVTTDTTVAAIPTVETTAVANSAANVAAIPATNTVATAASTANGTTVVQGITHAPRGAPRGRGAPFMRNGRGAYNPYGNGNMHGGHNNSMQMGGMEHGHMPMRRGGPPRGRGGYGQSMTRAPMHQNQHQHQQQHTANTQIAPIPSLKRGAPGGPPGPKRVRYDNSTYAQRPIVPKYHQQQPQHIAAVPPATYGAPPTHHHHQAQSHHVYATHEQTAAVDPYAQSYAAPAAAPTTYNGYSQSGYAAHTTHATPATQATTTYATHATTEYDQSQYQAYNTAAAYGAQTDTRYQTYGQDYTQQYGAPAVDYNTSTTADYSQHQQAYEDRSYAGYDTSYQQSYSNAGYY